MNNDKLIEYLKDKFIPEIKSYIKCIIVYGSRAEAAFSESYTDLDVFLLIKKNTFPGEILDRLVLLTDDIGIPCDPFWYQEEVFYKTIEQARDLPLFFNIFRKGKILYCEKGVIEYISHVFDTNFSLHSFQQTISYRKAMNLDLLRSLLRNLDRILTETIWLKYSQVYNILSLDQLPDHTVIAQKAFDSGLISEKIKSISTQLSFLKKGITEETLQDIIEFIPELEKEVLFFSNNISQNQGSN